MKATATRNIVYRPFVRVAQSLRVRRRAHASGGTDSCPEPTGTVLVREPRLGAPRSR